jgi:SAM-dependent methyltransferase
MNTPDSKRRFSNRVEYYVRYRPGYPAEVLGFLAERIGLSPNWVVADVGSGTGISTRLFLDAGHRVYAVEPNAEMRQAAEAELGDHPGFRSIEGSAEATTLPDACVDLVVAAQAFHWFDRPSVAYEFRRILRPGGWVVLLWNRRLIDASPFLWELEDLLRRFGTDYEQIEHTRIGREEIRELFGHDGFHLAEFDNRQRLDFESLKGRLYSASYCPLPGMEGHDAMLEALETLFRRRHMGGIVEIDYQTTLWYGRLNVRP